MPTAEFTVSLEAPGHEDAHHESSRLVDVSWEKTIYDHGGKHGVRVNLFFKFRILQGKSFRHHFEFATECFEPEYFDRWTAFLYAITSPDDIKDSLIYLARRNGPMMKDLLYHCLDHPFEAAAA